MLPQQHLYKERARLVDDYISARESTCLPVVKSMLTQERTRQYGESAGLWPSWLPNGQCMAGL